MTAPTTRETADHAELARMAEAATPGPWLYDRDGEEGSVWTRQPHTGELARTAPEDINGEFPAHANAAFIAAANPVTVLSLLSEIAALRGERDRLRTAVSKSNDEICQSLGKALGYPWFKDDQANFPGSTESDGVCVGDHVAESIADEASRRLTQAERQRDELRKALTRQCDNMAFVLNRVELHAWHLKFEREVAEDRALIANQGADQ